MTIRRIEDGVLVRSYKSLDLSIANADALIFGGVAKEGGDIKVYRDTAGNLQMSVDADAASSTEALVVYGGVVAQNYLTVGQTTLNTSARAYINGALTATGVLKCGGALHSYDNVGSLNLNMPITGTDAIDHVIQLRVDDNTIISARATGDGAGGITDKAVGLYGATPATQAAAISDPAESTAANNTAIDSILAALRGIGLIAT